MSPRGDDAALADYARKRNFAETPEPQAGRKTGTGNSFVIQKHHARRLHFDLRLEIGGVLKSWAVTKGISLDTKVRRLAVRTEDHPLSYGSFEGIIPEKQYGAGLVEIWDRGSFEPLQGIDPAAGLAEGHLKFRLHGERLRGGFALVRTKPEKGREQWLLIKEKDDAATTAFDPAETWLGSVGPAPAKKSAAAAMPAFAEPQLATEVDRPPAGDAWIHEIKFDGYRLQAAKLGDKVRLFTRSGQDWTKKLPVIAKAISRLPRNRLHLDGELIVTNANGAADFAALQADLKIGGKNATFVIFDCLQIGARDIRRQPWLIRNGELRGLLADAAPPLKYCEHLTGDGLDIFDAATRLGAEGIVSKNIERPWRSGRNRHWLKIKAIRHGTFLIGGYRKSKSRPFASLLLGERGGRHLIYKGRVGTGFSDKDLAALSEKFAAIERDKPPFEQVPADIARDAVWLDPKVEIDVGYVDETTDGHLRHARYIGLARNASKKRTPKSPLATFTNPDRVLFPEAGYTKADLYDYLQTLAPPLLRELTDRFTSLVRAPDGNLDKAFFQRHAFAGMPDSMEAIRAKGRTQKYLTIRGEDGLAAAAQFSVLEFHIWGAQIETVDFPDRLVFDLDPDEALPFIKVRAAARLVRDVLGAGALTSFPLLTGGKGVHVVAPLDASANWEQVAAFAKTIARGLANAEPGLFVFSMAKAKRRGRIFIDWHRNRKTATAIAPWSPRARAGAPVAVPVTWDELARANSAADYDLAKARRRFISLRRGPWHGYAALRQTVPQL